MRFHFRKNLGDPYGASEDERTRALIDILRGAPDISNILNSMQEIGAPDCWLVSGGIYQTVWNALTERAPAYGIKDYDIIYFDGRDLSYAAEDKVINSFASALPALADKIEVRNQARVHLWFEDRFGVPYDPLNCAVESLTNYASKTHAVAVRQNPESEIEVIAPFGLAHIFSLRLVPNLTLDNAKTYREKGARMKALWPELEIVPWPEIAALAASAR